MRNTLTVSLMVLFVAAVSAQRQPATVVYSEYFTSYGADSIPPSVTFTNGASSVTTKSPRGFRILGPFSKKQSLSLHLRDLPPHQKLSVEIGYHIIGPWSGVTGKETFTVLVDTRSVFSESFSNTTEAQSYPGRTKGRTYPARTGARNSNMLGFVYRKKGVYDGVMDATYENTMTVAHADSSVTIQLAARTSASWGLEHIVIRLEGGELPADIFPAQKIEEQIIDEEIVNFTGRDVRVLGNYTQDEDLPGLIVDGPWEHKAHTTLLRSKCNSCGSICMMYTYIFYNDGWVNVWSNREPFGPALFSSKITHNELETIKRLVGAGIRDASQDSYQAPNLEELPSVEHCDIRMFSAGRERRIYIEGGEPPSITALTTQALSILKKYGWWPTPFVPE